MAEIDADKEILNAVRDGIREGVKSRFGGTYNSPLEKLVADAISKHAVSFRVMLEEAIGTCLNDAAFRNDIATSVRSSLARTLIQRFGGEMEKQVNLLKSDPTTRARITLAIEEIVKERV